MHIAEGFLSPFWCLVWYLASLAFVIVGARKVSKIFKDKPEQKIFLAIAGAFIFVLSSMKLPSVTGSSSHPTGTGLAAIMFGPSVASFLAAIVLLFQAILLAHGGITTLGADIFSMGVVGPLVAFGIFKLAKGLKASDGVAVFLAGSLSDIATYFVTSVQLALAYPAGGAFTVQGVISSFGTFAGIFAITQIPIGIGEGILLAMFFDFVKKTRPALLQNILTGGRKKRK